MQHDYPTLLRQAKTAQYMLLATVIATVVNIVMLFSRTDLYIPYCAALPYYLTLMGFAFDGLTPATYTATGMVMTFVLLAAWMLVWWMAKKRAAWLKAGMILSIVDTAILAIYVFLLTQAPISYLLELVLHVAVIYEIHVGVKAARHLEQLQRQPQMPQYTPWDESTPTDTEYSDDVE